VKSITMSMVKLLVSILGPALIWMHLITGKILRLFLSLPVILHAKHWDHSWRPWLLQGRPIFWGHRQLYRKTSCWVLPTRNHCITLSTWVLWIVSHYTTIFQAKTFNFRGRMSVHWLSVQRILRSSSPTKTGNNCYKLQTNSGSF